MHGLFVLFSLTHLYHCSCFLTLGIYSYISFVSFSPVQGAACIVQVTPPTLYVILEPMHDYDSNSLRKLPTLRFTYHLDPSGGNACGEQGISISGPICGEVGIVMDVRSTSVLIGVPISIYH